MVSSVLVLPGRYVQGVIIHESSKAEALAKKQRISVYRSVVAGFAGFS